VGGDGVWSGQASGARGLASQAEFVSACKEETEEK